MQMDNPSITTKGATMADNQKISIDRDWKGELTRRKFFNRIRKLGFYKSDMQLTRNAVTYRNTEIWVCITIPKHHESTIFINGKTELKGIWHDEDSDSQWGNVARHGGHGMLAWSLGVCKHIVAVHEAKKLTLEKEQR
jgi:hypothetical protein